MPIGNHPLLEYWLKYLDECKINEIYINLHYHFKIVETFLDRPLYKNKINKIFEEKLLGTAGTLLKNISIFENSTTLLIHADNWTNSGLINFIEFHFNNRPKGALITMMTFETLNPESCGIVETDKFGVVTAFHEKKTNPPGNIANAAIYLIEPEVLSWLKKHPNITDFSTEVIPEFIGKIATWENRSDYIDIGSIENLKLAQQKYHPTLIDQMDEWSIEFNKTSKKFRL
jgi:mannose-1-phosphate guanylyltransferase